MTFTPRKKEILIDILVRLPAKSLVRFLFTCKVWSDLISSSSFVSTHLNRNVTKHAHVYFLCFHHPNFECLVDPDDPCFEQELQWSLFSYETFEQCSELSHPLGSPEPYRIYGSTNGLICISDAILSLESPIHIWNPSVRKLRTLPMTTNNIEFSYIDLHFGFHPGVNDYKAVRMMGIDKDAFAVEIYSLSTDSWKRIEVIPPWLKCDWQHYKGIFLNGVVYHLIEKGPTFSLMSFDSGNAEFEEFITPGAICRSRGLFIAVYKEQICLLFDFYCCEEEGMEKIDFWVLEEKQWTQLAPFVYPSDSYKIIGISIDNELLLRKHDFSSVGLADLYLCNYESKQVRQAGIKLAVMEYGHHELFFATTYIESLLFLNKSLKRDV
ncbi:Hypothetical predicted protein [Prunus dulcis]|uniref:S haplotype-specific F-box protein a n=1 Tax=Prunus dulcis TaxID=3755 RepID=Q84KK1_PRUDU|nr:F-box/kelch-repeat protein At3g06240-like [Prunus dulcis]BAC65206.1 S haplotype-specific F-box protein a [Prunus dulcis]VVA26367.1 Hypothetical predicted protein [Prunus dulcis]